MPTKAESQFYTVIAAFVGTIDGRDVEYIAGDVVAADDPGFRKHPSHFAPLVVRDHKRGVEQATAGPGEKRG